MFDQAVSVDVDGNVDFPVYMQYRMGRLLVLCKRCMVSWMRYELRYRMLLMECRFSPTTSCNSADSRVGLSSLISTFCPSSAKSHPMRYRRL